MGIFGHWLFDPWRSHIPSAGALEKMALIRGDQGRFHARKIRLRLSSEFPPTTSDLNGHAVLGVEKRLHNLANDQEEGSPEYREKKGIFRRDASGIVGQERAQSTTHMALSI